MEMRIVSPIAIDRAVSPSIAVLIPCFNEAAAIADEREHTLLVAMFDPTFDADELALALKRRVAVPTQICCSTAGNISPFGYIDGGAVLVLFLFVVMMLDVDFAELKAEMAQYMPLALLIGVILVMQFGMAVGAWQTAEVAEGLRAQVTPVDVHNTHALGVILYDDYFLLFQLAGLILLVAMIGAIVLTLRHRQDVKRQNVLAQMYRDPAKAMELKDVKPGQGL